MPCILHIETATNVCSVAISFDGQLLFYKEDTEGPSHASILGVFVEDAMQELRTHNLKLDAVAVSCGPGSYTGLRIGVSEAKGICYGLDIPLIAIETLEILAYKVIQEQTVLSNALFCPMIDARRMEVYTTLYNASLEKQKGTTAEIIDSESFKDILASHKVLFFGNGAAKCKEAITSQNAIFIDDIYPSAKDMVWLAEQAYSLQKFVDVAYYEPFYLKEFVGTIPKNKVLNQG